MGAAAAVTRELIDARRIATTPAGLDERLAAYEARRRHDPGRGARAATAPRPCGCWPRRRASACAERAGPRPPGDPGQRAGRPVPGRPLRGGAARRAAQAARGSSSSARCGTSARAGRASTSSCATRVGARAVLDVARGLREARPGPPGRWPTAPRSSWRAVPTTTPAARTSSPSFSFSVGDLRVAGEGDLLAQLDRLRRQLDAEGLFEPQKHLRIAHPAALDRGRHRGARQGARRRARGPAAPRLGGAARVGLRPRAGPPRRAAHRPARSETSRPAARSR